MQFIEDFYKSIWQRKTFPGLEFILSDGSDREKCAVINAINVVGVNQGIRQLCEFVGYMYGPEMLSDGTLLPDIDPPFGSEERIHARIGSVIRKYCKNVVYKKGTVLAKGINANIQEKNKEYILFGYHGGQNGNGHGELEVRMMIRICGAEAVLYSWTSSGSNNAVVSSYETMKQWAHVLKSVHPNLGAEMNLNIESGLHGRQDRRKGVIP